MKMKLLLTTALLSLVLAGCGNTDESTSKDSDSSKTEYAETKTEPSTPEITFSEFDKKYERDTEYESYMDGLFLLKDGTKLNADYVQYTDDDGFFDYASAIFYDGKLANLKIETSKSVEEVEEGLGIASTDNVKIDPTRVGFEITFDERFAIDNIERLPSEWE